MGGTQAETRAAGGQGTDSKEKTTPVLAAVWRGESLSTCWQQLATSLGGSGRRTPAGRPNPAPARGRTLGSQVKCVIEAEDAAGRSPEWRLTSGERREQAPRAVWMRPRAEALSGDSLGDRPSLGDGGETG